MKGCTQDMDIQLINVEMSGHVFCMLKFDMIHSHFF